MAGIEGIPPGAELGVGGLPGGFPGGFGFPGFGGGLQKNLNLDISGGAGLGGGYGGFPGGLPGGFGGFGGPYIPQTPLGALGGFKGDLLVPIVVVGVALFILLVIVLAVKAALTFKLELLNDIAGGVHHGSNFNSNPHFKRSDGSEPMSEDAMTEMTVLVMNALQSNCWDNMLLCGMGKMMQKNKEYMPFFRMVQNIVPESMNSTMTLMKESAERPEPCEVIYPCKEMRTDGKNIQKESSDLHNEHSHNFLNNTVPGKA